MIIRLAFVLLLFAAVDSSAIQANIFRWDNGELIPGTEGIEPGPGVQLAGVDLAYADLSGFDLTAANLEGANLTNAALGSTLLNANLSGAIIRGAGFPRFVIPGSGTNLTKEQLYSTASYQTKDLRGISIGDVSSWDLSDQNLTDSFFGWNAALVETNLRGANLTNAMLSGATLRGANLSEAVIQGAILNDTLTKEQVYSTASYHAKELMGIDFANSDLSGWDFSHQNLSLANFENADLTNSSLNGATLVGALLSRADLTGVDLANANLKYADLYVLTTGRPAESGGTPPIYDQNTAFSRELDPVELGFEFQVSHLGDFDSMQGLGSADIDIVAAMLRIPPRRWETNYSIFNLNGDEDLNGDAIFDQNDYDFWVKDLKNTWFGDANLDGEFNSSDLVDVFKAGEYEDTAPLNSNWQSGDWSGNGEFDTGDLVIAFQDGGYEQGHRGAVNVVPEPCGLLWLVVGLAALVIYRRQ